MNKNIVLLICLTSISPLAFSNQLPDFCKSGAFTCEQISPNSVVAYPVSNVKTNHNEKRHVTVENDNDTEKNMQLSDAILVDLKKLTWGAYDGTGELIRSGRVSGGKDYCPDIDRECKTVTGRFTIFRKGGEDCKSTIYPVGKGGAPMPYCMFFHGGYALHGSNSVPSYNASHGCVRMAPEDAQWLNEDFVQEGVTQVVIHY